MNILFKFYTHIQYTRHLYFHLHNWEMIQFEYIIPFCGLLEQKLKEVEMAPNSGTLQLPNSCLVQDGFVRKTLKVGHKSCSFFCGMMNITRLPGNLRNIQAA